MKDNILDSLIGSNCFTTLMQSPQEYEKLFDDIFGLSDLSITARVLNHWKDSGLLPDKGSAISEHQDKIGAKNTDREKGKRNKFNFFELIYLFIVQDLREFGFSLQNIKKVKETLLEKKDIVSELNNFSKDDLKEVEKMGIDVTILEEFLEYKDEISKNIDKFPGYIKSITKLSSIILAVLIFKSDVRIIITRDADVTFERVNSPGQAPRTPANSQPHIVLPVFLYLYRFLSMKKYKSLYVDFKLLDEQELLISILQ